MSMPQSAALRNEGLAPFDHAAPSSAAGGIRCSASRSIRSASRYRRPSSLSPQPSPLRPLECMPLSTAGSRRWNAPICVSYRKNQRFTLSKPAQSTQHATLLSPTQHKRQRQTVTFAHAATTYKDVTSRHHEPKLFRSIVGPVDVASANDLWCRSGTFVGGKSS